MSGAFGISDRYRLLAVVPPPKSLDRLVRIALAFGYDPADVYVQTYKEIGASALHAVLFVLKDLPVPDLTTPIVETTSDPVPEPNDVATLTEIVNVRFPPELIDRVKVLAEQTGQSVSGLVRSAINEEIASRQAVDDPPAVGSEDRAITVEWADDALAAGDGQDREGDTPVREAGGVAQPEMGQADGFATSPSQPADDEPAPPAVGTTPESFECWDCGRRFPKQHGLVVHRRRTHPRVAPSAEQRAPADDVPAYGCNDCSETRETVQQLIVHVERAHHRPLQLTERDPLSAAAKARRTS